MSIAIVASIVIHALLAGVFRPLQPTEAPHETIEHVSITRIEKRPRPTPTPSPPPIRPQRISHARVLAPTQVKTVAHTASGVSAHTETLKRAGASRPKTQHFHFRPTSAPLTPPGQGAGAGVNSGAGSLGTGGTGSGAGANGNGSGAEAGICGFVDFSASPSTIQRHPDGSTSIFVKISVHYADGHSETITLDYPWHYPDEASNPFAPRYIGADDASVPPARFQTPPPELAPSEPPIVQYVIAHSTRDGRTLLNDCPSTTSPASRI